MDNSDKIIIIGRIGAPYGLKGWVKINTYTQLPENILQYQPWKIFLNKQWQEVKIIDAKPHGKSIVVQFDSSHDRDSAATYTNADIAISRQQLPNLGVDDYYWDDLIGLTVINKEQITLGKVDDVMATGANDVLVVNGDKQYLIPYVDERIVQKVDLETGIISVIWDAEAYS